MEKKEKSNNVDKLEKKVASLEQENLMLNDIINGIEANIYWKDLNGRVSGINKFQEQNLAKINLKPEQVIGKTSEEIFSNAEIAHSHSDNDMQIIEHGKSLQIEEKNISNKKEYIYLSRKSPLKNKDGKIYGVLGVSIDITERKKLEEKIESQRKLLQLKNGIKNKFIEVYAKDILSSVKSMKNNITLLKEQEENNKFLSELIDEIHANCFLFGHLFEQMNLTIQERFFDNIELSYFDLNFMVNQEISKARQLISQDSTSTILLNMQDKFPKKVKGDAMKIMQVILNLILNAIKVSKSGKIICSINLSNENKKSSNKRKLNIFLEYKNKLTFLTEKKILEAKGKYVDFIRSVDTHDYDISTYLVLMHLNKLGGTLKIKESSSGVSSFWVLIPIQI